MSSERDWRHLDPRSKRALLRIVSMGYPLEIEIEGEPFRIMAQREGGSVYFYLHMTHAVDEMALLDMLSAIMTRNDVRDAISSGRKAEDGRILTLDDIIPGDYSSD